MAFARSFDRSFTVLFDVVDCVVFPPVRVVAERKPPAARTVSTSRPSKGLRRQPKFRSGINALAVVIPSVAKKPLAPSGKSVALIRASCPTERGVSRSSRTLEQDAMDADGAR